MAKDSTTTASDERRAADEAAGAGLTTAPDEGRLNVSSLGLIGWARWVWRQLTSMRIALMLLFLLALASVPGSLIPQDSVDANLAQNFRDENPGLASFYERLQLFEVYSSVWFSAIYLLLFISLIGCIVPRSWQFIGQLRGRPPRAPRRLNRMPAHIIWRTEAEPGEVLEHAHRLLRKKRFRADRTDGSVAAEKGYLREAGNLVFHLSLIVMLVAFAAGQQYSAEGGKLIVEGDGFTNTLTQYDDFESSRLYDVNDLERFGFNLDEFHASFFREGPDFGSPSEFRADVTYWEEGGEERQTSIEVNHPLTVGEAKIFLLWHGFAPVVTVTDGQGQTAFTGPVPFLPQDEALHSSGVIKVTDYLDENGEPSQLGFQGFFDPTFRITEERGPHSVFPEPDFPVLTLNAYHGDLGLESSQLQNVYQLDTTDMEQFEDEDGDLLRHSLVPGESFDLPDGKGTLTFEGYERWAGFQVSTKIGKTWALAGAMAAVFGLAGSLLLQRRRTWVKASTGKDGYTVVEMASLGRTESSRIPDELGDLAMALQDHAPALPEQDDPELDDRGPGDPGSDDQGPGGPGSGAGSADGKIPAPAASQNSPEDGPHSDTDKNPGNETGTDAENASAKAADPGKGARR